jgi:hypothetical protein
LKDPFSIFLEKILRIRECNFSQTAWFSGCGIFYHFRRVRSYPFEGEARFRALFIDLRYLEITTQATFLPYLTKDTRLIKIFTREEAEK